MNDTDLSKTSETSAMDIVSMAFSNVSESSDLIGVVNAVSNPEDQQHSEVSGTVVNSVEAVHDAVRVDSQPADAPNQNDQDSSGHIEIPLPHNAIITVNDQGEQIIELAAQVVDGDPHHACQIEHVEQVEQVEQIEHAETAMNHDSQPGPAGDVATMPVGGDGLETITFQEQDVGMVEDESCVVPVTISLTDVQNLQQTVSGTVPVGPAGETAHATAADIVATSSMPGLVSASASTLFGSFAKLINTSSVLTHSSSSLPAGVTFVSGAGVPLQTVPNVSNTVESQASVLVSNTVTNTGLISSANTSNVTNPAQFIHNGTNLQPINLNDGMFVPQRNQSVITTQATSIGPGPGLSTNQVGSLPFQKQDPTTIIGNRSVFSPMTLTIRTPPGAPAVNQALINSIVNNKEVQALLKRNPGQPITIVRVPEDPLERRNKPGVVTAKVVTTSAGSSPLPSRVGPGRPRKNPVAAGSNPVARGLTGRRRGRQPGTKLRRKEEDYVAPASWQPVKSRTRSGRISRPPVYRTENFKSLSLVDRSDNQASDAEGSSDLEADDDSRVLVTLSGRVKKFKCKKCSKAYIGRGGLARHFVVEPTHGRIEDYDALEDASPKPGSSSAEQVQSRPDELADSEVNDEQLSEGGTEDSKSLPKLDSEGSLSAKETVTEPVAEPDADKTAVEPSKEPDSEPVVTGRRGRPPGIRSSNSTKDDPDFKPGMPSGKGNAKSRDKRKENMRQALKFLNNDDYIDVCLPRLARHLSLWEFLLSKAEVDKEDTSQVLKVLQLFEELLSDVREMAVNCLEKAEEDDTEAEGIYLEEDDDLARILEFDKGWYKVSEPPPSAADLPFRYKFLTESDSVASTPKRKVEVVDKDELVDEETLATKRAKLQDTQTLASPKTPQQPVDSQKVPPKLPQLTDPKSITVHVQDGKVTTEQGLPSTAALKNSLQGNQLPSNSALESLSTPSSIDGQQTSLAKATEETPQASKPSWNTATPLNTEQQTLTPLDPERQSAPTQDAEKQLGEVPPESSGMAQPSKPEDLKEATVSAASRPQPSVGVPTSSLPLPGEVSGDDVGGQPDAWPTDSVPRPSNVGTQFVHAAQELASLGASADTSHTDMKVDPPDPPRQEETSVVVPEGSTIMQMQDGTFLVQRPDGTAMQIHTPEGMTIETVQELLSMEAGQG